MSAARTCFSTLRAPLIAALVTAVACAEPCRNRLVESSPSPGNQLRAVVSERDCGPTRPRQLHLSVIPFRGADPGGDGNALVVEPAAGDSAAFGAAAEAPYLTLEWIDRDRLRVSFRAGVRVVKSVRSIAAVRIEYVPVVEDNPMG